MAVQITGAALRELIYAAYDGVYNVKDPYKIDRKAMPWLSFLKRNTDSAPLIGPNGVVIKYQTELSGDLQGWSRTDPLAFNEANIDLDLTFPWSNIHQGLTLVHDDLEAAGLIVLPNQPRGKNFARPDSESQAFQMVNLLQSKMEGLMDKFDVNQDNLLLRDNSSDTKLPQGLDSYLPVGSATGYVSTGSIGGKTRASYPELQHYYSHAATYSAGGTLRSALTTARREANLRARGRTFGSQGIDFIMAGAGAIDRYVSYATANNIQFRTELSDSKRQVDIGFPDTGLHFEGIPIVHNPTFEILDAQLAPSVPWTRRMYLLNTKTWKMCFVPGKEKYLSFPPDEADVRRTRISLDSKQVLLPLNLNANAIVSIAA